MEIKHSKGSSKGSGEEEQNSETLAAVNVSREILFPELPEKMIVAIDGWAQTGKNTSGELVARHPCAPASFSHAPGQSEETTIARTK